MENNFYYISYEKQIADINLLVEKLKADHFQGDGWIGENLVLVNCAPNYSSILTQIVNHRLSHLNHNECFETLTLELPPVSGSQVWNPIEQEYVSFEGYLNWWNSRMVHTRAQYLFLTSAIIGTGRNFVSILRKFRGDRNKLKLACVYLDNESIVTPEFHVEQLEKRKGKPLFEWENHDNKSRVY